MNQRIFFFVGAAVLIAGFASADVPSEFEEDGYLLEDRAVEETQTDSTIAPPRALHMWHKLKQPSWHRKPLPMPIPELPLLESSPIKTETHRIIKKLQCPSGELVGNQCIEREFTPPEFVCPPHTLLRDNKCLSIRRPTVNCPTGFDLQKDSCKKCEVFPAELTCPNEDEFLEGDRCVKHIPVPPHCPPGFSFTDGECVQVVPSMSECPANFCFDSQTQQCARSTTVPASVVCPDGADLNPVTQKCITIRQDPPRCPKQYTYCTATGRCIQPVPEIPGPCPPGFEESGASCQQKKLTPGVPTCPEGYEFDGEGACFKRTPVPPRCPAGYQHSRTDSNVCQKIVPEIAFCPPETSMDINGLCERVTQTPLILCCASGFELVDGHCESYTSLAPRLSCEGECYRIRTTRVAFACPDDTHFVDDIVAPKCVRHAFCPPASPPAGCVPDATLRTPSPDVRDGADNQPCWPLPPPDCQQKEVIPAQPYCPEGGEIEGSQCVIKEPIVPEKICDVGELDHRTGQCIKKTIVPVKSQCPTGTAREGLFCIGREKIQPAFTCPEGSESGPNASCVFTAPAIDFPPIVEQAPVYYECRTGRMIGDGRTCVETQTVVPDMICPPGSEASNSTRFRCAKYADMIVPPPVEHVVRSSFVCPDGSQSTGPVCHLQEIVPPLTICPADAVPLGDGDRCILFAPAIVPPPRSFVTVPVPVCPPGATSRGTTCVSVREVPVNESCNEEYHLQDGECVRFIPMEVICPAGTTETPDGCLREIITAPWTKILKGCVHNVTPTCNGCRRNVTTECHGV